MPSVREKIEAAIEEMIKEGAKISAYAVEKRAVVSNGSVGYYDDLAQKVNDLKLTQSAERQTEAEKRRKSQKANITQASLDKKNAELKDVKRLKNKYYNQNKILIEREKSWAEKVGNLTMALHNERSQVSSVTEVIQLPKRGKR